MSILHFERVVYLVIIVYCVYQFIMLWELIFNTWLFLNWACFFSSGWDNQHNQACWRKVVGGEDLRDQPEWHLPRLLCSGQQDAPHQILHRRLPSRPHVPRVTWTPESRTSTPFTLPAVTSVPFHPHLTQPPTWALPLEAVFTCTLWQPGFTVTLPHPDTLIQRTGLSVAPQYLHNCFTHQPEQSLGWVTLS